MSSPPSDMSKGESFEIEYKGQQIELEYVVQYGLYDGEGDSHVLQATVTESGVTASAGFHFWRSSTRVANLAAKRALKRHNARQNPSTVERMQEAFSN